jgi:hypothetical protein
MAAEAADFELMPEVKGEKKNHQREEKSRRGESDFHRLAGRQDIVIGERDPGGSFGAQSHRIAGFVSHRFRCGKGAHDLVPSKCLDSGRPGGALMRLIA